MEALLLLRCMCGLLQMSIDGICRGASHVHEGAPEAAQLTQMPIRATSLPSNLRNLFRSFCQDYDHSLSAIYTTVSQIHKVCDDFDAVRWHKYPAWKARTLKTY